PPIRDAKLPEGVRLLARRHRLRWYEGLPWLIAIGGYFLFPDYLSLGAQVFIAILFALATDLILGYAGVITLGQAAFFGAGAYACGLLSAHGWTEPLSLAVMLQEAANKASTVTGGANGLQGMVISPILGVFDFDLYGHVAYIYCL